MVTAGRNGEAPPFMDQSAGAGMAAATQMSLVALEGVPEIAPGEDLAQIIAMRARAADIALAKTDVVVVAQKIVSKAEGRFVDLESVTPSAEAEALARVCAKDPRFVELVLRESTDVVRCV